MKVIKNYIYLLAIILSSCNNTKKETKNAEPIKTDTHPHETKADIPSKKDICWQGTIQNNIPVFLHYQIDDNIIIGEITYLNTKDKKPIKLLGSIEDDDNYRLLEFDKTGNITGIITGLPNDSAFSGSWFSPKTRKDLKMNLSAKDTIIKSAAIKATQNEIFGDYYYQYSNEGYQGGLNIKKLKNDKASFDISCVTSDPARNIANVEKDTVTLQGNSFIYKIPEATNCEFNVKFYKGFVVVKYTKGQECESQFGHNATIEGLYLKKSAR